MAEEKTEVTRAQMLKDRKDRMEKQWKENQKRAGKKG